PCGGPAYSRSPFGRRDASRRRDRWSTTGTGRILCVRRALRPGPHPGRPDARPRGRRPMAGRTFAARVGARRGTAGDLYRAADRPVLAPGRRTRLAPSRGGRSGAGGRPAAPLPRRGFSGPARADRTALHARVARRVGCRVRLVAVI